MVNIYSASSLVEADVIKSILKEEGIECFLLDKYIGLVYPPVVAGRGIRIVVEEKNSKQAKQIIKNYLESINKGE